MRSKVVLVRRRTIVDSLVINDATTASAAKLPDSSHMDGHNRMLLLLLLCDRAYVRTSAI